MIIKRLVLGALGVNCYIVGSEETKEVAIIDPGGQPEKVITMVEENDYKVKYILLTHGHGDHIGAVPMLKNHYACQVYMHGDDIEISSNVVHNHSDRFGGKVEFEPDVILRDYDGLPLGELTVDVFHTPGHTQGGVVFKVGKHAFVGDTLFKGSVGRYDLHGGNGKQLVKSIKEVIYTFDDDVTVYPGHGGDTTVGREKATNPYTM